MEAKILGLLLLEMLPFATNIARYGAWAFPLLIFEEHTLLAIMTSVGRFVDIFTKLPKLHLLASPITTLFLQIVIMRHPPASILT